MTRPRTSGRRISACAAACLALIQPALADPPSPQSSAAAAAVPRPEALVLQALRANPVTAPYRIATSWKSGQVVPVGTVGTRQIHDTAVRIAIASGYSSATTSGSTRPRPIAWPRPRRQRRVSRRIRPRAWVRTTSIRRRCSGGSTIRSSAFEPPLVSYPPWWRAVTARDPITLPSGAAAGPAAPGPQGADPNTTRIPLGSSPQDGYIEMTLDPQGVAVLRGMVPSLADRVTIGQRIAQLPGVSQVTNLLEVGRPVSETPPPPPQPDPPPGGRAPAAPNPARGADGPGPSPRRRRQPRRPGPSPQPGIREPART